MENSNSTVKIIGALLLGAAVGATIGILFAPDKGSNTRGKVLKGAQDMTDDLRKSIMDKANSFRNKAEQLEKSVEEKMSNLSGAANQKFDNLKHQTDGQGKH